MKRLIRYILIPVIGVSLFVAFQKGYLMDFSKQRKVSLCKNQKIASKTFLNGILIKKYQDVKNHGYKTLVIRSGNDTINSQLLVVDLNRIYDGLLVGDSIVKIKNSLDIIVFRRNDKITYTMDFDCD